MTDRLFPISVILRRVFIRSEFDDLLFVFLDLLSRIFQIIPKISFISDKNIAVLFGKMTAHHDFFV